MSTGITRRTFLQTSTAGLTALSARRVLGANERVGVGVIGFGLIGRIHTRSFLQQSDAEIVGLSEVYQPRMEEGAAMIGPRTRKYRDFRAMLEDKDICVRRLREGWEFFRALRQRHHDPASAAAGGPA